jgi:hypothetical protein
VPGLVLGVVGTFALALVVAYTFLRLRCRGIGPPFGRRSWRWAAVIVVGAAAVSAALGGLILAATSHSGAAYVAILVPTGLQLSRLPPRRDLDMRPRTWSAVLTLPFSRLYDRMGEDLQDWCDVRLAAVRPRPQWIADAAQYYWNQLGRVTDQQARADLHRWRDSIVHKIGLVRLIDLHPGSGRLPVSLQLHPSMPRARTYDDDDFSRLARRLETEALNELNLFLAYAYRLGYRKTLVYPFRPGAHRVRAQPPPEAQPAEPVAPDR